MRKTKITLRSVSFVLLLLFALPSWTIAAEKIYPDSFSKVLETSTLSRTEQAEVNAKAVNAVNAGVPSEDVEVILSRAINHKTDAGTINRFLDTSMSTKKEGLPLGPVLDRIEQGLSKGVPPERIAAASERLAAKLAEARPLVDTLIRDGMTPKRSTEREEAIKSSARALEKSIPAEDLKGMGAAVRDRRGSLPLYTGAVDTATYFAGSGMPAATASRLVRNAVDKGYSTRDLDSMVKHIDAEMKRGTRAEEAAAKMDRENMQSEPGMDRQDMRQNMMNNRGGGTGPGMGGHMR